MLNLHFSNRTEALAERLLAALAADTGDPFAVDTVIVPSAGLRRWLTLAIARDAGLCANVRFDFLAQWLWRQVAALVPRTQPESPFQTALLTWRVHAAATRPCPGPSRSAPSANPASTVDWGCCRDAQRASRCTNSTASATCTTRTPAP